MRRKNKNIYIICLFVFLFCISVGYAFLGALLSIGGNIDIKGNTWNLYYDNINIKSGSVTATTSPTTCSTSSSLDLVFSLLYPGEYFEFIVDVVNDGTVDAYLDSFLITPILTDTQKTYVNYTVTYQNGEPLQEGQKVPKGEFVRLRFRMEHRTDYTDSQVWFDNITALIKLNYVPDRCEGVSVTDNGVFKITASGSLDSLGTVVTIGTEQFYTIGTDGDNVKLLSMYNLYVGGSYDSSTSTWTPYGEEATGMQDSTMSHLNTNTTIRNGTTAFSSDEKKGTNYNDYQGSIVEEYVNNYKRILESKYGVDIVEARLITYE